MDLESLNQVVFMNNFATAQSSLPEWSFGFHAVYCNNAILCNLNATLNYT